jgi:hypothetical protein
MTQIKIGITGTRSGGTPEQLDAVFEYLASLPKGAELHHGDCVGADFDVATIAASLGMRIVCHPPSKDELRAFFESDETRHPLSYFARNRNIVDETDVLLVVPYQTSPQTMGGTWYTHDYAVKRGKPVKIFYPIAI